MKKLHPKLIDLSLDRIRRLLARLGNPELRLPPVIHIAGTNGKGSLVAYLRAIAAEAGYGAHSYISPHLVDFNERITLAGSEISDEHLAEILDRVEAANDGLPITLFEITTAAAFLAFAETPADLLILEVGLGGRLDATNLVEQPLLTAITPISLDHQNYLGATLELIAAEKAGIIKPKVPVIVGAQERAVFEVIARKAAELEAPVLSFGSEWDYRRLDEGFELRWIGALPVGAADAVRYPAPALFGAHQFGNAATAVAAADLLRPQFPRLTTAAVAAGLGSASWPARMQRLTTGALTRRLGAGDELWLDGGHNVGAGAALRETLAQWRDLPLVLIFGMLDTKDPEGFLREVAPFVSRFIAVTVPNEALAVPKERLAATAAELGLESSHQPAVSTALESVLGPPHPPLRILICGSLYLAGSVLALNRGASEEEAGEQAGVALSPQNHPG
ncbi:MAG: bifunctional folylpolyglutamate synthase/dihydrofolate synthase [Alphaproteobacteria bacterium]|nr:bifunctional folylpolyglutamate synthase/dihydrofolate synthase [Alphaproteobacteria bacterium]